MTLTELSTDDVPAKLEELLRSGWAFLLGDNDMIRFVEKRAEPEDFQTIIVVETETEKILKVVFLVRVEAFMSGDDICGLYFHSTRKWGNGVRILEYVPLPMRDDLVGGFVEMVLEKI